MKRLRKGLVTALTLAAAVAALTTARLSAHHSFAMYDQSIKYVFTGVVERINPDAAHLQIAFVPLNDNRDALVRDSSGKPANWLVEMGGSAASAREGISVNDFRAGRYSASAWCRCATGSVAGRGSRGCSSAPRARRRHPASTATRSKAPRRTAMVHSSSRRQPGSLNSTSTPNSQFPTPNRNGVGSWRLGIGS